MIKNIIANFFGKFWSLFAVYAFTPLYIHYLGIENYGLISFYVVILSFVGLMDAGLSATLAREFARNSAENSNTEKLVTLKTLESIYLLTVSLIIICFLFFSSQIANNWLNVSSIPIEKAENCIRLMGFMAAMQILINFYSGGLIGLEKQVRANVIQVFYGVLRSAGVLLVLIFVAKDIELFFLWQLLIAVVFVLVFRFDLIKTISNTYFIPSTIRFNKSKLKSIGGFAGGMLLISVVASINTQLDKLVISRMMNLEELGYYTLATTLAQGIIVLGAPFATAFLPRFTSLYSLDKEENAKRLFHVFLKLITSLLGPISIILILFAQPILHLWINDISIVEKCIYLVPYTVMGAFMLAIAVPSYCIVLANGYTKLNNIIGITSIFFTIPAYYFGIKYFGAIAAAICWFLVQFTITLVFNYFVNKKYFKQDNVSRWFFHDVCVPTGLSIVIIIPFFIAYKYLISNTYITFFLISAASIVSVLGTLTIVFKIRSVSDFKKNILTQINI